MEDNKNLSEQTTDIEAVEKDTTPVEEGTSENSDTSKENVNDVEFTDSKTDESQSEEKKTQSKEDNAEFARRRREQERKAELKKERYSTIIEMFDGVNPYTDKPMVDDADVEEYLAMKEISKKGGDPVKDFAQYVKDKKKEENKQIEEDNKREEWIKNDAKEFKTKFPNIELSKLFEQPDFVAFANEKIGKIALSDIYQSYNDMVSRIKEEQKKEAAVALANSKASPGSLTSSETSENDFFTIDEVKKMTQDEVHKNYDKIRKSMAHWNK